MKGTTGLRGIRNIGMSALAAMTSAMGIRSGDVLRQIAAFTTPRLAKRRSKVRVQQPGNKRTAGARELARASKFYMQPSFTYSNLRAAPIMCRKAGV
jgi:hypothetical protein